MIYGVSNKARVLATPGARSECPSCGGELRAKCGKIVTWHWAHTAKDCDPWSEGESAWHLGWKELAPPQNREVVIGPHRADIVTDQGLVIELQHSSISVDEIAERERFYGRMVWVIDTQPFAQNLGVRWSDNRDYFRIFWGRPRPSLMTIKAPLFFDIGKGDLIEVRKLHAGRHVLGWGYRVSQQAFIKRMFGLEDRGLYGRSDFELEEWMMRATHSRCPGCARLTEHWKLAMREHPGICKSCAFKARK